MACPYFIPSVPHPRELWPQRHLLPLGDGFKGCCGARTRQEPCDDETLRTRCNLGYAKCVHLPAGRELDAVRFHVRAESLAILCVSFTGERLHHPVLAGELRYDQSSNAWIEPPDPGLACLAEAAVRAWTGKQAQVAAADPSKFNCDGPCSSGVK